MLDPKEFSVGDRKFRFTPLQLTPARALYTELFARFGDVSAAFIEVFELTDSLDLSMESEVDQKALSTVLNPLTKSAGSAIRELTASVNAKWLKTTMDTILCPQLEVLNDDSNYVPVTLAWYEADMTCSGEIQLFLKILSLQYSDFLSQWEKAKIILETLKKATKSLISQKESIGK